MVKIKLIILMINILYKKELIYFNIPYVYFNKSEKRFDTNK